MEFQPDKVLKSMWFWGVIGLFTGLNLWTFLRVTMIFDTPLTIGVPLPFYATHSPAGGSAFYITGLLLDIAIALTTAVIVVRIEFGLKKDRRTD